MKQVKTIQELQKIGRRKFLGQASCAGLGYLTLSNTLLNLKAINASAISDSSVGGFNDYKAMVCILLAGGNDSFNTLIPYDNTSHNEYVSARSGLTSNGGLALTKSSLNSTVLNYSQSGKQWAVHPSMTEVKDLFNNDKLAFIANIGTLTRPTTKTDYNNDLFLPIGLFSHSDQIQQWQTGIPNERSAVGWAGKLADLIGDCNPNQNISMNISLSGSNILQTGNETIEYAIDPYEGAIGLNNYNPGSSNLPTKLRSTAVDSMIGQHYNAVFEKTYNDVIRGALDKYDEFNDAIQQSVQYNSNVFPDTYIGRSLEMVLKTIDARNELNVKRQIFFIVVGGWDHHDEVIDSQEEMLGEVSEALGRFQDALGSGSFSSPGGTAQGIGMEDSVVTFLISEFGRTLSSNGNGSDHAWGGNTLAMGGPVNGGMIYGDYPSLVSGGPQEVGLGRFIPTTSTDEFFCEIAKWYGVPSSDMTMLFPNIGNFYDPFSSQPPIGFLDL